VKKKAVVGERSLTTAFFRSGFLTIFFLSPFSLTYLNQYSAHDLTRIAQEAIVILLTILFSFNTSNSHSKPVTTFSKWLLVLFSCLIFISISFSPRPNEALRELSLVLGLFIITLDLALINSKNQLDIFLKSSVFSISAYSISVITIMLTASISSGKIQSAELFFGYDNFRFYNHVQTICLPLLALVTASQCCSKRVIFIAWMGLVTGFALLIVSAGRATAIGLLLASILSLFIFKSNARSFVWHLFLAAILGALLNILIIFIIPTIINGHPAAFEVQNTQEARKLLTTSSRDYLWDLSLQYIWQHPWFGIGPMHFAHYPNAKAGHPHNIYLQVAAEWGIPMMLSCLFIALRGLKQMSSAIRLCLDKSHQTIGIALFSGCVAVMVDGGFSGNFVMPISQMWIAVLIGLSISWTRSQQTEKSFTAPSQTDIYLSRGFKILLLTSQLWLIWSIYPEIIDLPAHLEQVKRQLPHTLPNAPRFWSFGWF
jgi:O-antigen ligase